VIRAKKLMSRDPEEFNSSMEHALRHAARGEFRYLGSSARYAEEEQENHELLSLALEREADVLAGRDDLIPLDEVMEEFGILRDDEK
jgi:hypothetical protein